SDLPKACVDVLGDTNGTIVYHLVTDIINTSFQNTYVAFSQKISEALKRLKDFNLERIYMNPKIKKDTDTIKTLFGMLFEKYLDDIEKENRSSVIFKGFLEDMSEDYIQNHRKEEIVRDFIAGMTDQYFLRQCPENMRPEIINK
ncbi:MAG: phosphohydrolase, partial [Deltaproteobacteria bacterium]|nr:phosphohydrolase [Deltaproteobacteria bacterium]